MKEKPTKNGSLKNSSAENASPSNSSTELTSFTSIRDLYRAYRLKKWTEGGASPEPSKKAMSEEVKEEVKADEEVPEPATPTGQGIVEPDVVPDEPVKPKRRKSWL